MNVMDYQTVNVTRSILKLCLSISILYSGLSFSGYNNEIDISVKDEVAARLIEYKVSALFEKSSTSVNLDVKTDESGVIIERFIVIPGDREIAIPDLILDKIPYPQLDTINISYTPGDAKSNGWSFSLRMYYGKYVGHNNNEHYSMIEISFSKDEIIDATIFNAETDKTKIIYEIKDDVSHKP